MNKDLIFNLLMKNYSIAIKDIDFLREGGSNTYIINGENEKFLLKVSGNAFMDTVKYSLDIMLYLRKHSFPVPGIIMTNNNRPYISYCDNQNDYIMVLYEFIEGIEPDIDNKAEEIGELTGKLHKIMTDYPGKLIGRSKDFFIDRYISILRQKAYPDKELAKYIKLGDMLWKTVENLPLGYAHGDLHRGNLLLTPEDKIYFLDFDTSCIAPRMFDIMVMCDTSDYFEFKPEDFEHSTTIFKRFLSAYGKYISLTEDEIRAFYDLVAIRHFQLQATIVEIFGLDCIDKEFIDKQLNWLISWRKMYSN